jgi:N-acetylglucosamine-6-phosphate deacetylase
MATEIPARLMGQTECGRFVAGALGDLALLDDDLHVVATIIGGEIVHRRA